MIPTTAAAIQYGKLCGLRILSPREAAAEGFVSITTDISAKTELKILSSIAKDRDPDRAVFIATLPNQFQLGVPRADVSDLADRLIGGANEKSEQPERSAPDA